MSYVSGCCTAPNPWVPDSDICTSCGEHASHIDDDCEICEGEGEVQNPKDDTWHQCQCVVE